MFRRKAGCAELIVSIAAVMVVGAVAARPQETPQNATATAGAQTAAPAGDVLGPEFEVATIRPANRDDGRHWFGPRIDNSGRLTVSAMTLSALVLFAYVNEPGSAKVSGGPRWAQSDSFDISAKIDDAYMDGWDKLSTQERVDRVKPMLRKLLVDRFQLKMQVEMQPTPVYVLVQAKGGAKLKEVAPPPPEEDADPFEAMQKRMAQGTDKPLAGGITCRGNACVATSVQMRHAVGQIAANARADRIVIDQTGLKGYYDFKVTFPNDDQAMSEVEDELGLKFEPRTVPIKTYILESAEKPSLDGAELAPTSGR